MANEVFHIYLHNARARGRRFELTLERAMILFKSACFYCGTKESNWHRATRRVAESFRYNGIDRLDNDGGYVEGNMVACCRPCNLAKRDMTPDQFIALAHRVAKLHPRQMRLKST